MHKYEKLKKTVYEANMLLPKMNLVEFTWGNVSEIDRKLNVVAIKPSGISYEKLKIDDIVVISLDGAIVEGKLNPSTDASTHLFLYNNFQNINGITHTHSKFATIWAQSGLPIPCYGTTHADNFYGPIPCTEKLDSKLIKDNYEYETGVSIKETFDKLNLNPESMPAILCNGHGPFTFGNSAKKSVEIAKTLELVSEIALGNFHLNGLSKTLDKDLVDKHYYRKHGKDSYYGQGEK